MHCTASLASEIGSRPSIIDPILALLQQPQALCALRKTGTALRVRTSIRPAWLYPQKPPILHVLVIRCFVMHEACKGGRKQKKIRLHLFTRVWPAGAEGEPQQVQELYVNMWARVNLCALPLLTVYRPSVSGWRELSKCQCLKRSSWVMIRLHSSWNEHCCRSASTG